MFIKAKKKCFEIILALLCLWDDTVNGLFLSLLSNLGRLNIEMVWF